MERFVAAALAAKVRSVARKHLFRRRRSRLEHLPWRLEIEREKFLGLEHVSPCCGKVCEAGVLTRHFPRRYWRPLSAVHVLSSASVRPCRTVQGTSHRNQPV